MVTEPSGFSVAEGWPFFFASSAVAFVAAYRDAIFHWA